MTETAYKRRSIVPQIMKYVVFAAVLVYIAVLMAYASGSSRPFEEVEAAVSSALKDSGLKEMDSQMLKRNFGLAEQRGLCGGDVLCLRVKHVS